MFTTHADFVSKNNPCEPSVNNTFSYESPGMHSKHKSFFNKSAHASHVWCVIDYLNRTFIHDSPIPISLRGVYEANIWPEPVKDHPGSVQTIRSQMMTLHPSSLPTQWLLPLHLYLYINVIWLNTISLVASQKQQWKIRKKWWNYFWACPNFDWSWFVACL